MKDHNVLATNENTGGTAYNLVPQDYIGDCKVLDATTNKVLAIFGSKEEAYSSATHAISPFFGYSVVLVEPLN